MALHQHKLFKPAVGAVLAVLCGLFLWATPRGAAWVNASYDYLFRFVTRLRTRDVVLIQMDNESYAFFHQNRGEPWNRALHAQLLDRLAKDGCRLVVFDVHFKDAGDPSSDQALADALRRMTNVVIAVDQGGLSLQHRNSEIADAASIRPVLPNKELLIAAHNNWGAALVTWDNDLIVRRHWPFPEVAPAGLPGLPSAAASQMGLKLKVQPQWLRYYDKDGAWDSMSYMLATNQAKGYFRDKIVFIGNKPRTSLPDDGETDEFHTPYTRWTNEAVGGMEILATEFLNLINGDWLRRPAWWVEILVLFAFGTLLGGGLCRVGSVRACWLAAGAMAVVFLAAIKLTQSTNFWFPWLVVAGGQVPCALVWALAAPKFSRTEVVTPVTRLPAASELEPVKAPGAPDVPDTPDYEITSPAFGQGSFGKVWVARTSIGQWVALKAVYQARFGSNPKPYEREFNGLRRYMPISHKHPGLLRINFISRKKREGYFYYVMELADALEPGWEQDPCSYKPRDLAKVLGSTADKRLPARECLRIAAVLADALDFLHNRKLTHGDVKPQNIIFVDGQPKLADAGLVNELFEDGQKRTVTGTPGYMRLGHPSGTPEADIYALGMVLYVMFMGVEPEQFPDITTALAEDASRPYFVQINSIILRACHPEPSRSFASAGEMAAVMRQAQVVMESESPAGVSLEKN